MKLFDRLLATLGVRREDPERDVAVVRAVETTETALRRNSQLISELGGLQRKMESRRVRSRAHH